MRSANVPQFSGVDNDFVQFVDFLAICSKVQSSFIILYYPPNPSQSNQTPHDADRKLL
jgi:hypothetical protein